MSFCLECTQPPCVGLPLPWCPRTSTIPLKEGSILVWKDCGAVEVGGHLASHPQALAGACPAQGDPVAWNGQRKILSLGLSPTLRTLTVRTEARATRTLEPPDPGARGHLRELLAAPL